MREAPARRRLCRRALWLARRRQEKPRNDLDMRHRLNSEGKREGKIISYKRSELRAVELMEGLCKRLRGHYLRDMGEGKPREWSNLFVPEEVFPDRAKAVREAQGKELEKWCDKLLEEIESDLTEAIKSGHLEKTDVEKELCIIMTDLCIKPDPPVRSKSKKLITSDAPDARELEGASNDEL
eukprot:SM000021S06456  [mRNA]  locus=s21:406382:408006:+ [translate_table: standard]